MKKGNEIESNKRKKIRKKCQERKNPEIRGHGQRRIERDKSKENKQESEKEITQTDRKRKGRKEYRKRYI